MQRHRLHDSLRHRAGWTLVELLVTITIIAVILAILFPALNAIRENARKAECMNNLRQIGIALQAFSDNDSQERFASGAADFLRDGCPGKIGWLANLDELGALAPEGMLCPSNPSQGSAILEQMLTTNTNDAAVTASAADATAGFCHVFDPADAGYLAPGSARVPLVADQVRKGFNTNYTPSWFLARGQITRAGFQQLGGSSGQGIAKGPFLDRVYTQGGLKQGNLAILTGDDPPANHIPILGDGQSGNIILSQDISDQLPQGMALVELFTRGPSVYDVGTVSIKQLQGSSTNPVDFEAVQPTRYPQPGDVVGHGSVGTNETTYQANSGDWTATIGSAGVQKLCLQDTRGWRPVHRGSCNLLMADGSVKSIQDVNGDGYLNPGFPVEPADAGYEVLNSTVGYTDGKVEMSSMDVFSGTFLHFKRNED